MTFWTQTNFEPKRNNRFKVSIVTGGDKETIPFFYVKTCQKPTAKVNVTKHKVAGRTFNFPGSIEWNPIKASFVDDIDGKVIKSIVETLAGSNYNDIKGGQDFTPNQLLKFISKNLIAQKLTTGNSATMVIQQLDANGSTVETWTLHNPILESFEMDELSYESDDLSTYSLTLQYDWAHYGNTSSASTGGTGGAGGAGGAGGPQTV